MKQVCIYSDGSCFPNPGPGAWCAIIIYVDGTRTVLTGMEAGTTSNRMELTGVIEALSQFRKSTEIQLYVDSDYVRRGFTEWLPGWVKADWLTTMGQPIKNKDLWLELIKLCELHKVTFNWIKGHSGHPIHDKCDTIARWIVQNRPSIDKLDFIVANLS